MIERLTVPGESALPSHHTVRGRESAWPFAGLMFFTFILFVAPQGMFPVLQPLYLAKTSVALAVATYLASHLGKRLTIDTPEVRLMVLLVVLGVASIPFSMWPGGSIEALQRLLTTTLIFILIANVVNTPRRMAIMVGSLALWGIIMSASAIRDFSAGKLALAGARIAGYDAPLTANPNALAFTLNLILALQVGLYMGNRSRLRRLLLLGAMGMFVGGVIATFSRGGFIGLLVILLLVFAERVRRGGVAAWLSLAGSGVVLLVALPGDYLGRLYSILDFAADETGSAGARWDGMSGALAKTLSSPVIGVGLGMNNLVLQAEKGSWEQIHNIYLQIGVELGLLGLAVYILLLWRIWRGVGRALARLRRLPRLFPLYGMGIGVRVAFVAYVLEAMFMPAAWDFYFFYIAGFAVAFQQIAARAMASREARA